jgi:hypothetical protein
MGDTEVLRSKDCGRNQRSRIRIRTSKLLHGNKLFNSSSCYRNNVAANPHRIFVTPDMNLEASDMTATHVGSGNHITFRPHAPFWRPATDWPTDPDVLITGGTSAHIAMHLACYMGASQVNLVGVDLGLVDGQENFAGYRKSNGSMDGWRQQFDVVVKKLRELYGVRFFRLQPSLELLVVE